MEKIEITLVRSLIKKSKGQKKTMQSLGLRKINQTVVHNRSSHILGMIDCVKHLIRIK